MSVPVKNNGPSPSALAPRSWKRAALEYTLGSVALVGPIVVLWWWTWTAATDDSNKLMNAGTAVAPVAGIATVVAIFVAIGQLRAQQRQMQQAAVDGKEASVRLQEELELYRAQMKGQSEQIRLQREATKKQSEQLELQREQIAHQLEMAHREHRLRTVEELRSLFAAWLSRMYKMTSEFPLIAGRLSASGIDDAHKKIRELDHDMDSWGADKFRLQLLGGDDETEESRRKVAVQFAAALSHLLDNAIVFSEKIEKGGVKRDLPPGEIDEFVKAVQKNVKSVKSEIEKLTFEVANSLAKRAKAIVEDQATKAPAPPA